jgi:hypothetical protein
MGPDTPKRAASYLETHSYFLERLLILLMLHAIPRCRRSCAPSTAIRADN